MTNNLKELISEKLEYYRERIRIIMKIEKELESKSLEQISDELIQEIKNEVEYYRFQEGYFIVRYTYNKGLSVSAYSAKYITENIKDEDEKLECVIHLMALHNTIIEDIYL